MTITELHSKIFQNELTKDPKEFIKAFEQNKELILQEKLNITGENHEILTVLFADYSISLVLREAYSKSLNHFKEAIKLFETLEKYKNKDLFEIQHFETLIFYKGIAQYYVNDFTDSKETFLKLVNKFPDNDTYKNWLVACKNFKRGKAINFIWYLVAAVVLITSFVNKEDIGYLYNLTLAIGALAIVTIPIIHLQIKASEKKIKNGG